LRQLQQRDSLPEEQLGAALAYLEVLWIETSQRAAETDAAYAQLEACEPSATTDANGGQAGSLDDGGGTLPSKARRYHAAVRTLREVLGRQVATLLAASDDGAVHRPASS
jgi:hypothetical protein